MVTDIKQHSILACGPNGGERHTHKFASGAVYKDATASQLVIPHLPAGSADWLSKRYVLMSAYGRGFTNRGGW